MLCVCIRESNASMIWLQIALRMSKNLATLNGCKENTRSSTHEDIIQIAIMR